MLAPRKYLFGEYTLDLKRGALFRGATEVRLRPKSFGLLQVLVERHGELVTKEELFESVWGRTVVTDGVITQSLIDVRRAIGDDSQGIIRTLPRRGYVFTAPVTTANDDPAAGVAQDSADAESHADPGARTNPRLEPTPAAAPRSTAGRSPWPRPVPAVGLLLLLVGALGWWGLTSRSQVTSSPAGATRPVSDTRKSIAVLPFANLTGAPDGEYAADGIAEEILHLLAQGEGLRVIARTSSFAFKGQPTGIKEIATKLHVDYVVEGSVRREGTNLRVNAVLVDASSSSHVWSKTYQRDVRDLLAVQQDIAQQIATALRASLRDARPRAAGHVAVPGAQDAFLRARFLFNRRLPGDLEKAEHAFQEALRLDPRFARAWAGLAGVYGVSIGEQGADVTSLLQKEREAIDAAIALDPQLPEARMRAARHYFRMGDLVRASSEMAIARELAPEDPAVLSSSVERIARAGRLDEAIDVQRRVVAADPLSRVARVNLANYLLAAGRLDEARTEFLNFVAMGARPDPEVAVDLARIDLFAGRYREAMVEAELWPSGPDRDFVLAVAGDGLRKHEVAREAEARLLAGTAPAQAVRLAELYAHRNDANQAFRWMNVAYDRLGRDPWLTDQWEWVYHLSLSPFLKPLRADARWAPTAKRGEPRSRAP